MLLLSRISRWENGSAERHVLSCHHTHSWQAARPGFKRRQHSPFVWDFPRAGSQGKQSESWPQQTPSGWSAWSSKFQASLGNQAFVPLGNYGKECKISHLHHPTWGVQWYVETCSSELQELIIKFSGILWIGWCWVSSLRSSTVEVLTPEKLTDTMNQIFLLVAKHLSTYHWNIEG